MSCRTHSLARTLGAAVVFVLAAFAFGPSYTQESARAQGDSSSPQISVSEIPPSAENFRFMDILAIDQVNHQLYTPDAWTGGIDIFDLSTPNAQYLKSFDVRGTGGGGTAWAANVQKVFISMYDGTVAVIDTDPSSPTTGTIIARVDTGGHDGADEMDYDPALQRIYVAHRKEGFIAAIDAVSDTMVGTISGLHGILEQPRYNAVDGMIYEVNPGDNVLYEYDPNAEALVKTIDIGTPCSPMGLAINPNTDVAFLGCGGRANPTAVYMDLATDTVIGQASITGGGDSAIYDPVADRFFYGSRGASGVNQMNVFSGGSPASPMPQLLASIPSEDSAGGVAYDETYNIIYNAGIQSGVPVLLGIPLPQ